MAVWAVFKNFMASPVKKEDPGAVIDHQNLPQYALLDIAQAKHPIWFTEIFTWLGAELRQLKQRTKIGKVRMETAPNGRHTVTIILEESAFTNIPFHLVPESLDLTLEKATPNQYVFIHKKDSGFVRILGHVQAKAQLKSKDIAKLQACRNWVNEQNKRENDSKIRKVDNMLQKIPKSQEHVSNYKQMREQTREKKDKRIRKSEEVMRMEILQAFKDAPEWSLGDMSERVDQGKNYVRAILADMADYDQVAAVWRIKEGLFID